MEKVYLSRKNLLTLLSKLDRVKRGESSHCTLIKSDNIHPDYPQTMDAISVTAVEDDKYYAYRDSGEVLPADDPTFI